MTNLLVGNNAIVTPCGRSEHYLTETQCAAGKMQRLARTRLRPIPGDHLKETTMRKTVLTILGASLIVVSTIQIAAAAERHAHNLDRARSQQFRNANDAPAS